MPPSILFFSYQNFGILKKFNKFDQICTRKTKISQNFPISLLKNSEISPGKKNIAS